VPSRTRKADARIFELDSATDALQALATEHVRGKLAITVR
jgi:hypothetical protein